MKRIVKLSFMSLAIAAILVSNAFTADHSNLYKAADGGRLTAIAREGGRVRIIVQLDVPDIENLTEAANAFDVTQTGALAAAGARAADAALSSAISYISNEVTARLQESGLAFEINHTYMTLPLMALSVPEQALYALDAAPEVIRIIEDKPEPPLLDEPMLNNTIGIIGADDAWAAGYTGEGWYVAVLDTGIRSTHQMFAGKLIAEACFSLGSDGAGPAGDCPNGLTEMTGTGSAVHHPSSYFGYDHGTHVAGIATGNNGSTLFGVARDADIIAVQVFSRFSGPAYCFPYANCVLSYNSDQLAGLEHVYSLRTTYNIAAVNMSIGGGSYSSACDSDNRKLAIDNLRAVGIATVIASGNDAYCGSIGRPACISTAIAVGASTDADAETSFSNWSPTLLDVFAPGDNIYSSIGDCDACYDSWDGTSMATPHVAGAFALLKDKNPLLSVTDLLTALTSTGVSITTRCSSPPGSKPRIQVDAALAAIAAPPPPDGSPDNLQATAASARRINLTWQDNSTNEDGFKIERKIGAGGTYSQITMVGTNITTYSNVGLTPSTTYYYRVRAYNAGGDSSYSNEDNATTPAFTGGKDLSGVNLLLTDE
jgi:subtilisin family serine protease